MCVEVDICKESCICSVCVHVRGRGVYMCTLTFCVVVCVSEYSVVWVRVHGSVRNMSE